MGLQAYPALMSTGGMVRLARLRHGERMMTMVFESLNRDGPEMRMVEFEATTGENVIAA